MSLTTVVPFFRKPNGEVKFANSVADIANPTREEIDGALDLTPWLVGITGFKVQQSRVTIPDVIANANVERAGGYSFPPSAIKVYDDEVLRSPRSANVDGCVLLFPYGDVPGYRMEVWPVTLLFSYDDDWTIEPRPVETTIPYAITAFPQVNAIVPTPDNVETFAEHVTMARALDGVGVNLGSGVLQEWTYAMAADHGLSEVRFQVAWQDVEVYATPGTFNWGVLDQLLDWCDEYDLRPLIVGAYGPPWDDIATVTVNGSHPVGSTSIVVNQNVSGLGFTLGKDHIAGHAGLARTANYGSAITGITGSFTVNLAAAATAIIPNGTTLTINRVLYATVNDATGTDASSQAYANYVDALADKIGAHGLTGSVEIWNEPQAHGSFWFKRALHYDNPTGPGLGVWPDNLTPLVKAVAGRTFPTNVTAVNGETHTSGFSVVQSVLGVDGPFGPFRADGMHPYAIVPSAQCWGTGPTCVGTEWDATHVNMVGDSSFGLLAKAQDDNGNLIDRVITEVGYGKLDTDPTYGFGRPANVMRTILKWWGMGVSMVNFYTLDSDPEFSFADYATQTAYVSLTRIGQLHDYLATVNGELPAWGANPIVASWANDDWPLFTVKVGPLTAMWARTIPVAPLFIPIHPTPEPVTISEVPGKVLKVYNTATGVTTTVAPSGGVATINVGAEPLLCGWRSS